MGFSFPFLRAKDLRTSLLITITCSFFTLLYVGGIYAWGRGGGQRPQPYVLTLRRLSEGRGFSNQIFFCWTSLYVVSGTKCMHVTESITKDEKGQGGDNNCKENGQSRLRPGQRWAAHKQLRRRYIHIGRTPTRTPTRMRRERREWGATWERTKNWSGGVGMIR